MVIMSELLGFKKPIDGAQAQKTLKLKRFTRAVSKGMVPKKPEH